MSMFGGDEEVQEELLQQQNPDDERLVRAGSSVDSLGTPAGGGRKRSRGSYEPRVAQQRSSKTKMLNKKERTAIMAHIESISLLEKVKRAFRKQECPTFERLLMDEALLTALLDFYHNTFVMLYKANDSGKDKYISFQLEWHKYCAIFLLPKDTLIQSIFSPPTKKMVTVRELWLQFSESNWDKHKKFMISFTSIIYNALLDEVHAGLSHATKPSHDTGKITPASDGDDVYFRFGGGTLAAMLHNRYKEIRKCSNDKRDVLSMEIKVLQTINTKEKTHMPHYLQYRDKGHMYTPDANLIPFFRAIDENIKSVMNEKGLQEHGDQLIKVAHALLCKATCLKKDFIEILTQKASFDTDIDKVAIQNVYDEMLRKLCNTRIQEFLSSFTQKITSDKGQVSTTGQNLRDQLLTQHIKVQSRVHID